MKINAHYPSAGRNVERGMTLIEVLIYAALLSFLVAGFIASASALYARDVQLMYDIQDAYPK